MAKLSLTSRGQRMATMLLAVATLASVVCTQQQRQRDVEKQRIMNAPAGRRSMPSLDFHDFTYVEMPPQHRLLPARKPFFALFVITKVCSKHVHHMGGGYPFPARFHRTSTTT